MCTHSRNVCESEFFRGTYGGLQLVVSELDSKLRGLGLRPGLVNVLCSLAKVFSLRVLSPPRKINGYWQIFRKA